MCVRGARLLLAAAAAAAGCWLMTQSQCAVRLRLRLCALWLWPVASGLWLVWWRVAYYRLRTSMFALAL
jgi:hypothetical protein